MRKLTKKRVLIIVACFLLTAIIAILCIEYVLLYHGEFSSGRWNRHPSFRYKMVDDMEYEIDIRNLNRDEIIALLGKREMRESDSFMAQLNGDSYYVDSAISYVIGSFSHVLEYYIVQFDDDGKVIEIVRYIE